MLCGYHDNNWDLPTIRHKWNCEFALPFFFLITICNLMTCFLSRQQLPTFWKFQSSQRNRYQRKWICENWLIDQLINQAIYRVWLAVGNLIEIKSSKICLFVCIVYQTWQSFELVFSIRILWTFSDWLTERRRQNNLQKTYTMIRKELQCYSYKEDVFAQSFIWRTINREILHRIYGNGKCQANVK